MHVSLNTCFISLYTYLLLKNYVHISSSKACAVNRVTLFKVHQKLNFSVLIIFRNSYFIIAILIMKTSKTSRLTDFQSVCYLTYS